MKRVHTKKRRDLRSGQVLIIFAFSLVFLLAVCVLVIDVGRVVTAKAELQNAVDAAALAGASQITTGFMTETEKTAARAEAIALAGLNMVAEVPLTLTNGDIQFGHYDDDLERFIPEAQAGVVDSLRVVGRRTESSPDGPIDLFFGSIFGWDNVEIDNVVSLSTKPRRYVMFTLDRSGSMSFDTSGVSLESYYQDPTDPTMKASASGWYWFPHIALKRTGFGWQARTAWFIAKDESNHAVTDFLPDHIKARLDAGRYFNFRPVDYPDSVESGWIKVPEGVTIHGRWGSPWHNWLADSYYHVIWQQCGYARAASPVQPLQSTMDAACAFVDLMRTADDRVGLVTYGWKSSLDSPLTSDFDNLKFKIQSFVPAGATAEPNGMKEALDELILSGNAEGFGQRIMILLTDGFANMLNGYSYDDQERTYSFLGRSVTTQIHPTVGAAMATQAVRARNAGVRVYCVTFGADVDRDVHLAIASETSGAYYYAANHEDLTSVFVDIFRRLPPVLTQ